MVMMNTSIMIVRTSRDCAKGQVSINYDRTTIRVVAQVADFECKFKNLDEFACLTSLKLPSV